MSQVATGLTQIKINSSLHKEISGNIGLVTHAAAIDDNWQISVMVLKKIFGPRLKKLFGPQHGFVSDVQDNMVESSHYFHPYFQLQVYSLYSETRVPTDEMLEGLDTIVVDLQDVGTRIYTYIYTLTLLMEACAKKGIKVVVLDRPNPIGGELIEGNILEPEFSSFVGRHPLPVRHALTMGEVGLMAKKFFLKNSDLVVIPMKNWKRSMSFDHTKLPWVLPSPNLATVEAAFTFVGTVLFEGTNISEGRGTARALEILGHPKIEAFSFVEKLSSKIKKFGLVGFELRACTFLPTFNKHQSNTCGGFQIHVTDRSTFRPWRLCQFLCHAFYHELKNDFQWKEPPYEYEFIKKPVDLINGTDKLRLWIEKQTELASLDFLDQIEKNGLTEYLSKRDDILLYN